MSAANRIHRARQAEGEGGVFRKSCFSQVWCDGLESTLSPAALKYLFVLAADPRL